MRPVYHENDAQAKKQALMADIAAQEKAIGQGMHNGAFNQVWAEPTPAQVAMHGFDAQHQASLSQGPGVEYKQLPQPPSQPHALVPAQQGLNNLVMMPHASQHYSMPSQPDALPQHYSVSSEAVAFPQQHVVPPSAIATPQQYSMPQKQGGKHSMPGVWDVHAASGHMAGLAPGDHSSTFAVPADKVGGIMLEAAMNICLCMCNVAVNV